LASVVRPLLTEKPKGEEGPRIYVGGGQKRGAVHEADQAFEELELELSVPARARKVLVFEVPAAGVLVSQIPPPLAHTPQYLPR
jgi:hypothetical protein